MVGVGVIIVGHGWCWCNYSRPCLVHGVILTKVGPWPGVIIIIGHGWVGVIIVGYGWCWYKYSRPWLVLWLL